MNRLLLFAFFWYISTNLFGQAEGWEGTYGHGISPEIETLGRLYLYPTSDSTVLFALDLNRGSPSYNIGELVGEIIVLNDSIGIYSYQEHEHNINCKLTFIHKGPFIQIIPDPESDKCGFGYGVSASGKFGEISIRKPVSIFRSDGKEIIFDGYDWRNWWK